MTISTTRRAFLAGAGSGLFVLFHAEGANAQQEPRQLPVSAQYPQDLNAYLRIGPDGRVACFSGKVELGQGAATSLAGMLSEELDVAIDSVDMVLGDTQLCPPDGGTFGSLATRQFGPALRQAGAEARAALMELAAVRLDAPFERLQVKNGIVSDSAHPEHGVSYTQLVEGKRIERTVAPGHMKAPAEFKVIGHDQTRKDGLDKVTGKAKYAGDFSLPGMLCARILRPPAHGAKLKSADTSGVQTVAGARIVQEGDFIAVLHGRPDLAAQAFQLVKAEFETATAQFDDETVFDHLVGSAGRLRVVAEAGNLESGEKDAAVVVEDTYLNSYVAHATIETHSATAQVEGGKATVWASTQTPFPVQRQVAQALGLPTENVRVIAPYVGGGFGGKNGGQQAVDAARLSKMVGKPVQVVLDRGEEFFEDAFRPAAVVTIRAGVSAAGKLVLWNSALYAGGDREAKPFYDIPHQRTVSSGGWQGGTPPGYHPFAVGAWRAPSVNTNTFARESQMDGLAAKLGVDPVEFRLNQLSDERMRRVLEAVAEKFGWKPASAPSGRGFGVACGIYSGTYVATMAQVAVQKATGKVQALRVVTAMDEGLVVNPDGTRQQIEGAIMMGLGYALSEEVRFRGGAILDKNFDTYELPRFSWMPKIETVLVENRQTAAGGCGEPPIITMGAVIANAIYDAAGIRLRQLPMTEKRIREGLQKA